jgi:CMP-N-acetylneuraminic acid synthetase
MRGEEILDHMLKLKVLGVIQARGGSKGIHKKNIFPLAGKPLISYTIEAAIKSKLFDEIVVSTDCEDISNAAKASGAEVPFMRPEHLSGDTVWSRDSLKHAVLECEKIYKKKYDYVIEMPCVSPLRNYIHLIEAFEKLVRTGADSVTSVCKMQDKHPVRMKRIKNDRLEDFCSEFPEGEGSRRQDLEPCYIRNGAIYSMKRDCIVNEFSRHGDDCRPYVMDEMFSVNIDTMIDLKLAELLINDQSNK